MQLITFQSVSINVVESTEYTFLMSSKDVAIGYDVSEAVVRSHKNNQSDELIEGTHFIMARSANNAPKTMWTKLGVVTLGFFIKSEKAKEFRKWAANYVLHGQEQANNDLKSIIMQQNEQIAQLTLELNSKPKRITEKPQMSATATNHLLDLIGQVARYIEESEHMEKLMEKRRERVQGFLNGFVRNMKNKGITEQANRRSEEIDWQMMRAQK